MFLHWQSKLDRLFDRSKKIVPVHLRVKPIDYFRPITALCNYKTKEVRTMLFYFKQNRLQTMLLMFTKFIVTPL